MATKVEIANMALAKLGLDKISSLTEDTNSAKLINTIFDNIALEVMLVGVFTHTIKRATLATLTTTPDHKYSYQYQLPSDCLAIVEVYDTNVKQIEYELEGTTIVTDESSLQVKYVAHIQEPGLYGPYLTQAIEFRLAQELAYPLTGDRILAELMDRKYDKVLEQMLAHDGAQGSPQTIVYSNILTER